MNKLGLGCSRACRRRSSRTLVVFPGTNPNSVIDTKSIFVVRGCYCAKLSNCRPTAFAARDPEGMAARYHDDVRFSDEVFPDLRGLARTGGTDLGPLRGARPGGGAAGHRPGSEPEPGYRDRRRRLLRRDRHRRGGLTTVDVDSTGIGLTVVKRIIEVHGGRVWIESMGHDSGCTVCFTLPQESPDAHRTSGR